MNKLKLNIIGCGHLGRALAKLWAESQCFEIGEVLNRSIESSTQAVDFIGAGVAIDQQNSLSAADVFLIATADSSINHACKSLVESGIVKPGNLVFHCSGALSSAVLQEARLQGAYVCSVHPVKSFADPAFAVATFQGTYCGVEGDQNALDVIEKAMQKIGGKTFAVKPEFKTLYHAASVMVCNYLTALMEMGVQTYQQSGLGRDTAMQVMQPMVRDTLDNIFRIGTLDALSGPVARGDYQTVENQLSALSDWKPEYAKTYARLGEIALQLSRQQGNAEEESLQRLQSLFSANT